MVRHLTIATLALAFAVAGPRLALAQQTPTGDQDDISVGPAVQANAARNLANAESAYSQAGNASGAAAAGGISGAVNAAGGAEPQNLNQVLAARATARAALEDAITVEEKVIATRAEHLKQSGDDLDANALLATLAPLQDRMSQLQQDAANDAATRQGAPLQPLSVPRNQLAGGGGVFTAGGSSTTTQTTTTAGSANPGTGAGGLATPAGGGTGAIGGASPVAVSRQFTGKLILVVKGDKPETALANLDKECERIRKGEAPSDDELDLPAAGVECWVVEKWQDKKPVRVRLTATPDNTKTLTMLKLKPGVTITVEGMASADPIGKGAQTGEVFALAGWKQITAPAAPVAAKRDAAEAGGDHPGE